ncbi:hypothetical protein Leryth_016996 [Lithospermum erythrorhizon]|uniref:Uncharacterized protein n=1 Tax=Lithospermum erythrorhizon TaxID=34254 RepID=A0AAV3PLQ6_LITER|nr:hypothetical protein Leryth_016996 [Lithospermum erythrorhizon]
MHQRRSTFSSILDFLYMNPLPFPLLLLFLVISLFLGVKFYVSFESVVEATEESMGWFLMATPLVILIVVRLLSTVENIPGGWLFLSSPFDRQRRLFYQMPSEGSSPWASPP